MDMAAEIRSGRYKPEEGDRLALAGTFNRWNPDTTFFSRQGNSLLWEVLRPGNLADSIVFKAVIRPANPRPMAGDGWETIPNRILVLTNLSQKEPLRLEFDKPFRSGKKIWVTFSVNVHNWQVLDWFNPSNPHDEIRLTGNFLEWSENGYKLEPGNEPGVYAATVPVWVEAGQPVHYKYRMKAVANARLQRDGWETRANRMVWLGATDTTLAMDWFDDRQRVVRLVVENTAPAPKTEPAEQLVLWLDGVAQRTEPLMRVSATRRETAVQLPLSVHAVEIEYRGTREKIDVPLDGRTFLLNNREQL
jgi:hypothetical protein